MSFQCFLFLSTISRSSFFHPSLTCYRKLFLHCRFRHHLHPFFPFYGYLGVDDVPLMYSILSLLNSLVLLYKHCSLYWNNNQIDTYDVSSGGIRKKGKNNWTFVYDSSWVKICWLFMLFYQRAYKIDKIKLTIGQKSKKLVSVKLLWVTWNKIYEWIVCMYYLPLSLSVNMKIDIIN